MSKKYVETFTQRCLKCSNVNQIDIEQSSDKKLKLPTHYRCTECNHKGKFGEQTKVSPIITMSNVQTVADDKMPPVQDEDGNICLVVGGKRVPFTLGRIQIIKKEIATKMAQLTNLEKIWEKELQTKDK